ncbi:ABC transporter substrate-binding protein [Arcobacter sp. LA11]|uniref:ABC transporter substrate-binding protein n=1 Tax=Arcobacter sp. LA11 TaxID=1898176 RepID=UPI0009324E22|nr:helical backbone metal receptor [Arcobacter sp. LA11]
MNILKKVFLLFLFTINLIAGERIITLSPSINEIVFALGNGKDIVANTKFCNFPEESKKIPKIGGYASISLEKMLVAKPTLVLAQDYDNELILNIKKLKLNVKTFKTNNLKSIKNTISSIGMLLKKNEKADELNNGIDNSLENIKNIISNKKILVVISPREDLNKIIYVAGNNLYFNDIIEASGNKNAYVSSSLSQPIVNVEKIIKMNPDVIIMLAPYINERKISHDDMKKPWLGLPINAAKEKMVYIIDKEYAGIPSNRVVNFINDFRNILEDVRSK